MEEAINDQWQLPIAELRTYKRTGRRGSGSTEREAKQTEETESKGKRKKEVDGPIVAVEEDTNKNANHVDERDGVKVSIFDYSFEHFFHYLDTISQLCGEPMVVDIEHRELQRLSSSVTFLREWKSYQYEPKEINFAEVCRDASPLLCFSADTGPIRYVACAPIESNANSANVILTTSHGGLKFWDIRDPFQPLWDIHPSQRIIYGLDGISDPRNQRESHLGLHTYNCLSFAVWSVQVSKVTDGNVVRFQLTAKAIGSDYARNRPPQFLCGSFSMEESTLVVNSPVQNAPLHWKPSNKQRDSLQTLGAASKQEKISALCNGDDPSIESEPPHISAKSKEMSKANTRIKRKPAMEQTDVCEEDNSPNTDRNVKDKLDTAHKFEAFPPKIVAVKVVRWNMNRGSEKWLCYGGASGLVRCQEIILSEVDKKRWPRRDDNWILI